ncbi:AbrB/MazE/SpoVT family DNA-binding domain-containing protein [Gloeocapsa sp. PCC 73106]|uniref:AbrB/MazE/SpoVT family DNA-binding domain-containing protein n=1 Tax=Gloeocapsa sp. PCC 73106 TaxID=102232 RepID=UPI0002ACFB9E|nr:AbrB/MazE/SpoVT family DNA-binding domain-containing protein [Gloeocapsa sp. PCC 73106]ELR99506.1 looped-hinge helix DNA binding domain, AbrB family [Gloeocapsa sp. PCC 73106]
MTEKQITAEINKDGRILIPSLFRKALNLKEGEKVLILLQEREIRVVPLKEAVKKAQGIFRSFVPEGKSLSEELIKERHEEAKKEKL